MYKIHMANNCWFICFSNEAIDIRESALNNDKLDDAYIQAVASHTLSILFSKLTGHYIRMSVTSLLDYINKNDKWTSNNINTAMVIVIEHIHVHIPFDIDYIYNS